MNRRRTSDRIMASHSARSVKGQRPRARKRSASTARWASLDRLRAGIGKSVDQWAERASERAGAPGTSLIGFDVSRLPRRLQTRSWAAVLVAAVLGALFLAVLRMDVIRMRFTLAQAFEEELRLEELKRELTVDMRQLRDPAILAERAEQLGFRRAERLIDLEGAGRESPPQESGEVELAAASRAHRQVHRP